MSWVKLLGCVEDGTRIVVVSEPETYRKHALEDPLPSDLVLEIGCSTGATTRVLATKSRQVLAIDISKSLTDVLQQEMEDVDNVSVARRDARDVNALRELMPCPDLVFVDVGGDALLPNVCSVLRQCLLAFSPRQIVVRSHELGILLELIDSHELPEHAPPLPDKSQLEIEPWLDLSRSSVDMDRAFAARRLRALGTPEALARLAELVDDPQPQVRRVARSAVQKISSDSARGECR